MLPPLGGRGIIQHTEHSLPSLDRISLPNYRLHVLQIGDWVGEQRASSPSCFLLRGLLVDPSLNNRTTLGKNSGRTHPPTPGRRKPQSQTYIEAQGKAVSSWGLTTSLDPGHLVKASSLF